MSWERWIGSLQPLATASGPGEWYREVRVAAGDADSFGQAIYGGRLAATPGLAFLGGYQAALRALWPAAPAGLGALCTTERRRVRPADMATRCDEARLSGCKDFVTAGAAVQWLLVSAREEGAGERPRLGLFVVAADASGVTVDSGPLLPIIPDIAHGRLRLERAVGERLPGDGWSDHVRPFRTHEDLHVMAALGAWLYGVALYDRWPASLLLRLAGLLGGAAEAARMAPDDAAGHLLLAGLLEQFAALQPEIESALGARGVLWQRDRAVMALAREAQARRLELAAAALGVTLG